MSFQNFTFPQVENDLGLVVTDGDLFSAVPPVAVRPDFQAQLEEGANLAVAINTEKARSEFAIAPVLFELRRTNTRKFGLFSGVLLDADPARGLNGYCDFVITKSARQYILTAPLIAIVEAKNDNVLNGLSQCIATMYAAQLKNQVDGSGVGDGYGYGATTTGTAWKFLRLRGNEVTIDVAEYHVESLGQILGILGHIVETA